MGGQVTAILALAARLRQRGVDAELMRPDGLASLEKSELEAYTRLSFPRRMREAWRLLRQVRARTGSESAIFHLVLPSPSFAWLAAFVDFPKQRILLQYEGMATRLDAEHLRAFRQDPLLLAPRLLLNHHIWSLFGRFLPVSHLGIGEGAKNGLQRLGFPRVFAAVNLDDLEVGAEPNREPGDPLPPGRRHLGYIGHPFAVKGVPDLLAAFARAVRKNPALHLLLAISGEGQRQTCERHIERLGLSESVRLTGLVDVGSVLKRLDALVLPYRSAITTTLYPSLILEAAAMGCPLVTTDIPEWSDIFVRDDPRLHIVPPGDVTALAGTLAALPARGERPTGSYLRLPGHEQRVDRFLAIYGEIHRRGAGR